MNKLLLKIFCPCEASLGQLVADCHVSKLLEYYSFIVCVWCLILRFKVTVMSFDFYILFDFVKKFKKNLKLKSYIKEKWIKVVFGQNYYSWATLLHYLSRELSGGMWFIVLEHPLSLESLVKVQGKYEKSTIVCNIINIMYLLRCSIKCEHSYQLEVF